MHSVVNRLRVQACCQGRNGESESRVVRERCGRSAVRRKGKGSWTGAVIPDLLCGSVLEDPLHRAERSRESANAAPRLSSNKRDNRSQVADGTGSV